VKSKLTGYDALCTANPYPVIQVGDGKNNILEQRVKSVNERDKEIANSLNPQFFRVWEFDMFLPEDWRLELQIMDKAGLAFMD